MTRLTKAELIEENDALRSKLEAAYDIISEALDYDEDDAGDEEVDEEGDEDA